MILATVPKAVWYLTRGSGAISLILLTVSVVLGITTSMRWATPQTWDARARVICDWYARTYGGSGS